VVVLVVVGNMVLVVLVALEMFHRHHLLKGIMVVQVLVHMAAVAEVLVKQVILMEVDLVEMEQHQQFLELL
jgi:hypothetical protein